MALTNTEVLWELPIDVSTWFPKEIYDWIACQAKRFGVPEPYIVFILLVSAAYLSCKTNVVTNDNHIEPLILYAIVGGGSGTNKTSVIKMFKKLLENITSTVSFESGTNDGLHMALRDNKGCCITLQDEFSSFYENLDRTPNSIEKKKLLSMYNEDLLHKATKTGGYQILKKTHFHIFGYTQVQDLMDTARDKNNLKSGFIQRFMLCVPKDVYVFKQQVKEAQEKLKSCIDIGKILSEVYKRSVGTERSILLDADANALSDAYYDETTQYRMDNPFKGNNISVVSKSRGLVLRIAAGIALLRECLDNVNNNIEDGDILLSSQLMSTQSSPLVNTNVITKYDFESALKITRYVVKTAMIIFDGKSDKLSNNVILNDNRMKKLMVKQAIPQPENMTMEFLMKHRKQVIRILKTEIIEISQITKNTIYPEINGEKGRNAAERFVRGLVSLELGKICLNDNGIKSFKRYHPDDDDENCPNKEELVKKWKELEIDAML